MWAKSLFDCREYDRCAAVFIPNGKPRVPVTTKSTPVSGRTLKGKERVGGSQTSTTNNEPRPDDDTFSYSSLSQRSLFLALYAKFLAGEKRKDEDSEMILGPADGGVSFNKELTSLIGDLGAYLEDREAKKIP